MNAPSQQTRPRSKVQRITEWFGMSALPRFSINLPGNYALIVARHDDRIRIAVGTASHVGEGTGGTHLSLTRRQAETLRDGLSRLLEKS